MGPNAERRKVITALGFAQIFSWGSSYYLPAVLATSIADETGWPLTSVVGGLSVGLLTSGLISPRVGLAIERRGGRPVLAVSAVLLSIGLASIGVAQNIAFYLCGWIVLGVAMGMGLYDPAFATLGRLYGRDARSAITALTLFGGFASTVCWPLSAFLSSEFGWRGTCLIYAVFHLACTLPIYLVALPRETALPPISSTDDRAPPGQSPAPVVRRRSHMPIFYVLAITTALSAAISSVMSVHLIAMLQANGITLAAAVALGALVGPSQVGARFLEMLISHTHHPIWTKIASATFVAFGLYILWTGLPVLLLALLFYGAGIGLESIARGTLPLTIFGPQRYPSIIGKLAMASLIMQAVSPPIGAYLMEDLGIETALRMLLIAATVNVGLVGALFYALPRPSR